MIANQGMGDVGSTSTAIGGSIGTSLLTAGAIAGGPTNPIGIGLMVAGGVVMLGTSLLHVFGVGVRNPYEDKDVATLNQMEQQLQANVALWNSSPHTTEAQGQALAVADYYLGQQLPALCSDPGLGANWASGCINDRKRGGKWDWYAMYRDPIANSVVSDPIGGSLISLIGGSGNLMFVGAGALVLGIMLAGKD